MGKMLTNRTEKQDLQDKSLGWLVLGRRALGLSRGRTPEEPSYRVGKSFSGFYPVNPVPDWLYFNMVYQLLAMVIPLHLGIDSLKLNSLIFSKRCIMCLTFSHGGNLSMKTRAAVVRKPSTLTIETIDLEAPKAGELLVRMRAAGVCHSDLHTYRGELRVQPPLVLGHEGAGIVEAVGEGVTRFKRGDAVLINWLPACNTCPSCLRGEYNLCQTFPATIFQGKLLEGSSRLKTEDGLGLKHYLGAATMAEYAVISEPSAILIPEDVPFEIAAVIGCAVATGVGAVINTAKVPTGSSAAVIGCGGIGLSMILGCQLAGCYPIIAVDVMESKLEFARQLGASHTVNAAETPLRQAQDTASARTQAKQQDVIEALRALTGGGPDYVFDSVGSAITVPQALQAARPGGAAVIVGLHAGLNQISIPATALVLQNRRLLGSFVGSTRPQIDLPKLIDLYRAGRLNLDPLISKRYELSQVDEAFQDMEAGSIARGVIMFEGS
jgi:S-(hydroxymethyl)glutathione dehydrogenase / alcohol dehydrogenase